MTLRFDLADVSTTGTVLSRGAAPVGHLQELAPVERAAILYMRAWCDGAAARDRIARDFRDHAGPADAETAIETFDALMRTTLQGARRPLMRHDLTCRCIGGDESAFANFLAAALGRDRDDAMLFACNLMTPPAAFEAVRLAETLAPVLLRIARAPGVSPAAMDRPSPSTMKH